MKIQREQKKYEWHNLAIQLYQIGAYNSAEVFLEQYRIKFGEDKFYRRFDRIIEKKINFEEMEK